MQHYSIHRMHALIIAEIASLYQARFSVPALSARNYAQDTLRTDCNRAILACSSPGDVF